jgi:V8-like Glu-specific endopeptidase
MFAVRAFLVPLLLGLASVASASIFGSDDRLVIGHSRGTPFAPIGVAYDPASNLYGTAILVDECHVLTAEHIVGNRNADLRGDRFDFLVGQQAGKSFEQQTGATVVANGGFSEKRWNRDADWLLLKLDLCLGRKFGHVRLHDDTAYDGPASLQSAGYPSDLTNVRGLLVVDPHCRLVGVARRLWLHTCAGRSGDSGGPLFNLKRSPAGLELEVYAIQAAAFPTHVQVEPDSSQFDTNRPFTGLNEAVPVANILPKIRKYLRLKADPAGS